MQLEKRAVEDGRTNVHGATFGLRFGADTYWINAAIAAGGAILGGLMGNKQEGSDTRAVNAQNYKIHQENLAAQKESLQNSVSWRLADAKRAGVHPLYALGMQPMSTSPTGAFMQKADRDYSYIADAGQNISRALEARQTARERLEARVVSNEQQKLNQLTLERAALENDLIRSQIARNSASQIGPPEPSVLPMGGASPSRFVQPRAAAPVVSHPGNPAREAGNITSYGFERTPSGGLRIVPSDDAKQRSEDSVLLEMEWYLNNRIGSWFSGPARPNPRDFPTRPGYEWKWNWSRQQFEQRPIGQRPRYPFNPDFGRSRRMS